MELIQETCRDCGRTFTIAERERRWMDGRCQDCQVAAAHEPYFAAPVARPGRRPNPN